jgi:hypothetical protein
LQVYTSDRGAGQVLCQFLQIAFLEQRSDNNEVDILEPLALKLCPVIASILQKLTVLYAQRIPTGANFCVTCAGAPPASTCSISPPTVTLNGSSVSTATLTLKTTASVESQRNLRPVPPVVNLQTPILIFVFALLCSLAASTLSLWKGAPFGMLLLLLCVACVGGGGTGCANVGSGGGGGGSSGTPVGYSIITLTGSSGGVTHGTAIQVFIE